MSSENPYKSPETVANGSSTPGSLAASGLGPPTRVRYIVFVLACLTSWFTYLHRYTWNVIQPELANEYGFSNTQLAGIFTIFNFSYAFGQIPSGIVCDMFGPHVFLTIIIVAWSLTLPLQGITGNPIGLGGIRLLFGFAQAGSYPSLGNVTRTWFPRSRRTIVQGFVASAFGRGGGAMASLLMASVLMGWCGLSWRFSLVVLAGAGVVFAVIFALLYRNSPKAHPWANDAEQELVTAEEPPEKSKKRVISFRQVFNHGSMRVLVFQQFLNAGADIVYTAMLGSFFASKGIGIAALGVFVSLPLWGGALGGVTSGFLNDMLIYATGSRKWGRRLVGFSGKFVAAFVLLLTISQSEVWLIGVGLFVVKFFADWTQPTVWGTCTDLGGKYSATVFSINNTSGNIGALVTPLMIGPLLDFFTTIETVDGSPTRVTDFVPMFIMVAIMYIAGACCWFAIDCSKPIVEEG